MAGDYTRFTFKADKNYSEVRQQQGRVSLDADWNEGEAIDDRHWRSETFDILGRCVVPAATPQAFEIAIAPGSTLGEFTIGVGRLYLDGLQVENHGLLPQQFDPVLAELHGTEPVPYSAQPYYPKALAVHPETGRSDLIYLHVWQREVTALEDPELLEIALDGPDTTTRQQTAWQVQVLENVGEARCPDVLDVWDDIIEPSAGRLTTNQVAPGEDKPCIISPSGGYRGLENRLYRVEIHTPGIVGTAMFKWSRDNVSVRAAVDAISPGRSQITVRELGRDQVLRFNPGDWVEVLDDYLEFRIRAGENNVAGHMAKIAAIDEAHGILTIDPAIPHNLSFDATDANRHTRVQRWDQTMGVDSDGLLKTAAGPLELEDGVLAAFSIDPANRSGEFKRGDYWVFTARTADGSVEKLTEAPPRGVHHHYCRLAVVHWGATVDTTHVHDCRRFWPPAHCCVSVRPGEDIQAAIDALPAWGGCICLMPGVHEIYRPLLIDGRENITLMGVGAASKLVFAKQPDKDSMDLAMLYVVGASHGVALRNFLMHSDTQRHLIVVDEKSRKVTIEDMHLVNGFVEKSSYCVFLAECAEVDLLGCRLVGVTGLRQGTRRNVGAMRKALAELRPVPPDEEGGAVGIAAIDVAEDQPEFEHVPLRRLRVDSSEFYCWGEAIRLVELMGGTIQSNRLCFIVKTILKDFVRADKPAGDEEVEESQRFYEQLDELLAVLPENMTEAAEDTGGFGILSDMLEDVTVERNTIMYRKGMLVGIARRVRIRSNVFDTVFEGVGFGFAFDIHVDDNELRVLGEEKGSPSHELPLAGYFTDRENTGRFAVRAQFAKGLNVCRNTISAPTAIGNAPRDSVFPDPLLGDTAYRTSLLRIMGLERLWRVSLELVWFLYRLLLFVFAVAGSAVKDPLTKDELEFEMYKQLAQFLVGPFVPYFIGKAVIADNRMTVRHFGVYFHKVLSIGGLRIHRNRVSGFDHTGILVSPWFSIGLVDAFARFARCTILHFIAFLSLLRDALAEYLEGKAPGQPASEAGITGYMALGVSWIVMLCQRYCGAAAGGEPGGGGGEEPTSPAEVLKDSLDDFLDHVNPAWIDDLVNQSYEIDKNVVSGVGDGIYTGIDGSRIRENKVTLWPANTVPYETIILGGRLAQQFIGNNNEILAFVLAAVELDRDLLLESGSILYNWPVTPLDNSGFRERFSAFLTLWNGYVDPTSPLASPIKIMREGLKRNSFEDVGKGWNAMIDIVMRGQIGYGIVMRGANMVCKGNEVHSETGCGGRSVLSERDGGYVSLNLSFASAGNRVQTPSEIPAIGGIWQYTSLHGWLIEYLDYVIEYSENLEGNSKSSNKYTYIYRILMALVAFGFLFQVRDRRLHIAENEVTLGLVHGIRTFAVANAKEMEILDNVVKDVARHGILHSDFLNNDVSIKVHRNTLTKSSGVALFLELRNAFGDLFASLASVSNTEGTTLMSQNHGDDKTSSISGTNNSAIYVNSQVVCITANHVETTANRAFTVIASGDDNQHQPGLFTDNISNKPNYVFPASISSEPNITNLPL